MRAGPGILGPSRAMFRHCWPVFPVRLYLPTLDARFVGNKVEDVEVRLVSHAVVVERESSVVSRYRRLLEYSTASNMQSYIGIAVMRACLCVSSL